MTVELNGRTCCLLGLSCCIPPAGTTASEAQASTLGFVIHSALATAGYEGLSKADCAAAARAVLEHVDLVPKGAGSAIVAAYSPWLVTKPPTKEA